MKTRKRNRQQFYAEMEIQNVPQTPVNLMSKRVKINEVH